MRILATKAVQNELSLDVFESCVREFPQVFWLWWICVANGEGGARALQTFCFGPFAGVG